MCLCLYFCFTAAFVDAGEMMEMCSLLGTCIATNRYNTEREAQIEINSTVPTNTLWPRARQERGQEKAHLKRRTVNEQ